MTHQEKLAAVTAWVAKAVPGIRMVPEDESDEFLVYREFIGEDGPSEYPDGLRLEDILRTLHTIREQVYVGMDTEGWFSIAWRREAQWTLGQPLHLQPEPTIDFLYSLIP